MAACGSDTTAVVEGEEGVTMVDVLHDEQALEADANAVLGDVSDTACTYPLGYLPRQPVYACNTCSEPEGGGKPAGVCLACSYHCHEVGMAQAEESVGQHHHVPGAQPGGALHQEAAQV